MTRTVVCAIMALALGTQAVAMNAEQRAIIDKARHTLTKDEFHKFAVDLAIKWRDRCETEKEFLDLIAVMEPRRPLGEAAKGVCEMSAAFYLGGLEEGGDGETQAIDALRLMAEIAKAQQRVR